MITGLVGKTNVGKSCFFAAATLVEVPISNYPFTTIDPNRGIAFVQGKCLCKEFNVECNPRNSQCKDGLRLIPINIIDVAGLVPGAHMGRGLGNKFLDDLRQADAFIHIVDAAGSTDEEGRPCKPGTRDPVDDVRFLEVELTMWMYGIIRKDWDKLARRIEGEKLNIYHAIAERLSGIGVTELDVKKAIGLVGLDIVYPSRWTDEDLKKFASELRRINKPMIIAANKADIPIAEENIKRLKEECKDYIIVPTSSEAELLLRRANEKGLIEYTPGNKEFKINDLKKLDPKQIKALELVQGLILNKWGSTGVQEAIDKAVFDLLKLIVIYPVEDENKLTDKDGNVLPDALLLPQGSTARDLAYKIHTDLGETFVRAIDCRTKRHISANYQLKNYDVIKIIATAGK